MVCDADAGRDAEELVVVAHIPRRAGVGPAGRPIIGRPKRHLSGGHLRRLCALGAYGEERMHSQSLIIHSWLRAREQLDTN